MVVFFFSSRRRHTRSLCDWSSDVCSSDLERERGGAAGRRFTLIGRDGTVREVALALNRQNLVLGHPFEEIAEAPYDDLVRSEERRVGKACRSRWSPEPETETTTCLRPAQR